jgi:hypothetical protein
METPFFPTRKDVDRYRRLRAVSMQLNQRIIQIIPRQAYLEVGDAIGILRNGVLKFDNQDMSSVLMDCCLYDWFENGKNVVQRYSESLPANPGTDERLLLDAYLQAKYRVVVSQSVAPDAGIHCQDVLNNEELFLMDLGMSQTVTGANVVFATRTIPLGGYWMTSGAGLPIHSKQVVLDALSRIKDGKREPPAGPGRMALLIVRACLAAGSAGYIYYQTVEAKSPRRRS